MPYVCIFSSSANTKFKHSYSGLGCSKTIIFSIVIVKKKHNTQMKSGLLDHDGDDNYGDQFTKFSLVFSVET